MGGFYGGLMAGAVSVLALGAVLSLNTPLTSKPQVTVVAPEVAPAPAPAENTDLSVEGQDADLVDLPPETPTNPETQTDTLAGLSEIELAPDSQPVTGSSPSGPQTPDAPASPPVSVTTDAPAAPPAPTLVPSLPEREAKPDVTADSVQPPQPQPVAEPAPEPDTQVAKAPDPQTPIAEEPDTQVTDAPEPEATEAPDEEVAVVQPEILPEPAPQSPPVEDLLDSHISSDPISELD